ncbi:hypothetical protein ROZALSC1DRAFT_30630 [Rozella allomycis CSF55]|uniref:Uncharacterized protein n=1 Tax=Rozella allomycis (strain CSF55) TaxID=988480 RepID=A0A075AMH5_ROZAC|nr:hypothetical protein O9G_005618 [Rozella allomycis CSF55]RKP17576.1 hypothetical protein ROZALSC1DRAFT_30630 [Rozella allomycis CSF55]|eukprot:EPZ30798.1 hypothetical protein O9G_005618 [Rozella allomycis CSF55]
MQKRYREMHKSVSLSIATKILATFIERMELIKSVLSFSKLRTRISAQPHKSNLSKELTNVANKLSEYNRKKKDTKRRGNK